MQVCMLLFKILKMGKKLDLSGKKICSMRLFVWGNPDKISRNNWRKWTLAKRLTRFYLQKQNILAIVDANHLFPFVTSVHLLPGRSWSLRGEKTPSGDGQKGIHRRKYAWERIYWSPYYYVTKKAQINKICFPLIYFSDLVHWWLMLHLLTSDYSFMKKTNNTDYYSWT